MEEVDYFRESFKSYKRKNSPGAFCNVIDFELNNYDESLVTRSNKLCVADSDTIDCSICLQLGLVPHPTWQIYTLQGVNGFFFIKNPFSILGQQHWIQKCLDLYPHKPFVTNLDLHHKNVYDPMKQGFSDQLSWATLGYHHNWDTKEYDPSNFSSLPECLTSLSKHIASCLEFKTFKPEAAIVNYYNKKSNLGIHNDHSEEELNEPIISLSFGQTALFLIGTSVRTDKPVPLFLRSGDIIVLSGASRLAYHAVPAIVQEQVNDRYTICGSDVNNDWKLYHQFIVEHRMNISVRQVYCDSVK